MAIRVFPRVILFAAAVSVAAAAQMAPTRLAFMSGGGNADAAPALNLVNHIRHSEVPLLTPVTLPRMAPELALEVYQHRSARQARELGSYSAVTVVDANLPDLKQSAEFELNRHYVAPTTLQFSAVHFSGDTFVKTNVITRLLQSEVDHLQKDSSPTALDNKNYKFSYKGTERVGGRTWHVFQLKPRAKRPGLFKGRMYVDAFSGSLARVEGRMVKSPSLFVKDINFSQDYADIENFTFPVHIHSEARARLIGRVVVDMTHRDYRPSRGFLEQASEGPNSVVSSVSR